MNEKYKPQRWDAIIKRLDKNSPLVGAEIGVWEGSNSYELLKRMPNIAMHYMIDPYLPYDDIIAKTGKLTPLGEQVKEIARLEDARLKAEKITSEYADRRHIIYRSSIEAANRKENRTLDYVFIDADHSYEGALSDIRAWLPKVKPGGWLCGHNFDDGTYDGVTKAVTESFNEFEIDIDWTWFYYVR